jgi:hypothetical protein
VGGPSKLRLGADFSSTVLYACDLKGLGFQRLLKNSDARFEGRGFELRVGADAPSAQPSELGLRSYLPPTVPHWTENR